MTLSGSNIFQGVKFLFFPIFSYFPEIFLFFLFFPVFEQIFLFFPIFQCNSDVRIDFNEQIWRNGTKVKHMLSLLYQASIIPVVWNAYLQFNIGSLWWLNKFSWIPGHISMVGTSNICPVDSCKSYGFQPWLRWLINFSKIWLCILFWSRFFLWWLN